MKILMIDDESDILEIYKTLLENEGHQVKTCMCPKQSILILEKEKFDVVISDYNFPKIKGNEIYKSIPKDSFGKFLFITGSINTEVEEILSVQAKVLNKPVDFDLLLKEIN